MKSKKIILDTNLWISFLISHDYSFLDNFIEKEKVELIFSAELYSEFITVSKRPKFRKFFSAGDIERLTQIIGMHGKLVEVTSSVEDCRDHKDNFILNLALDSAADYIVTGDSDLLAIEQIGKTKIVSIKELKNILL
jgi:uncharacterized protein